jgi:hypothetical protein
MFPNGKMSLECHKELGERPYRNEDTIVKDDLSLDEVKSVRSAGIQERGGLQGRPSEGQTMCRPRPWYY